MSRELATRQVTIGDYVLSVTTRDIVTTREDGISEHMSEGLMEELTLRTIVGWMYIVSQLEQGNYTIPGGSVEAKLADEKNLPPFSESFTDSRVTVWDSYRGAKNPNFHLNSDDIPQYAVNAWLANNYAIDRAIERFAPRATETAPASAQTRESVPAPVVTPEAPKQPVNGVIQASRAPNPKETLYAEGQLVAFNIVKVSVGANKGSATYALWGTLGGGKYPLMTVYKCKPNSDENSLGYIAIKDTIVSMNLSLDKPEAHGNWRLTCQAAHKDGKEYLNPLSLESVV